MFFLDLRSWDITDCSLHECPQITLLESDGKQRQTIELEDTNGKNTKV